MITPVQSTMKKALSYWAAIAMTTLSAAATHAQMAHNPIIRADVPDMAMIRVGDTYYMSSTTMHMSPGLPIMKSKDLVNWDQQPALSRRHILCDDVFQHCWQDAHL